MTFQRPTWKAQSYGDVDSDNATHTWMNRLDSTHNLPLWFGPWAGGIVIDGTQDLGWGSSNSNHDSDSDGNGNGNGANTTTFTWPNPQDMVVHAMADGEWGGVQFKVATASKVPGNEVNTQLTFSYGGWQQARGALLSKNDGVTHGNRFYVEGSIEFLDTEGEWHLDQQTKVLSLIPPAAAIKADGSGLDLQVVATQTDTLFEFVGADGATDRVANIVVANMTLAHTSARQKKRSMY